MVERNVSDVFLNVRASPDVYQILHVLLGRWVAAYPFIMLAAQTELSTEAWLAESSEHVVLKYEPAQPVQVNEEVWSCAVTFTLIGGLQADLARLRSELDLQIRMFPFLNGTEYGFVHDVVSNHGWNQIHIGDDATSVNEHIWVSDRVLYFRNN